MLRRPTSSIAAKPLRSHLGWAESAQPPGSLSQSICQDQMVWECLEIYIHIIYRPTSYIEIYVYIYIYISWKSLEIYILKATFEEESWHLQLNTWIFLDESPALAISECRWIVYKHMEHNSSRHIRLVAKHVFRFTERKRRTSGSKHWETRQKVKDSSIM